MKDKFQLIFKPFLLILVGLTLLYTFLHWLLLIEFELFSIKKTAVNFLAPAILAASIAWLFIRPKLKILNLQKKRGSLIDFYCFILWIILILPLVIAQEYIVTATGRLTELNSVRDINKVQPTKYYTVEKFYTHKAGSGVFTDVSVSGKNNERLDMHIYVAVPIFEKVADTLNTEPSAWQGVEYNKTISNRLEPAEKEEAYGQFAEESRRHFANTKMPEFIYLDRLPASEQKDGLLEAIKTSPYKLNQFILIGVNEPFEARNGNKLPWIFGSALTGSVVWLIMLLVPKINQRQLDRIKAGKPDRSSQKEVKEFFSLFLPRDGYYITPILVNLNIAIYLLMVISGTGFISFNSSDLLQWGANYGPMTKGGDWWRLLTSTFLHGGIMHLFANMYGLLFVGIFLEPVLGKTRYLAFYILTGILASVASIWWYDATVSVGASGAIFGLYGFFLALLLTKVFTPELAKAFLISTVIFIGFNLLMGIGGGIDNAAHLGGLISGFVIGCLFRLNLSRKLTLN